MKFLGEQGLGSPEYTGVIQILINVNDLFSTFTITFMTLFQD